MSWDGLGLNLKGPQGDTGASVDGLVRNGDSFQVTVNGVAVGSPLSLLIQNIDGGSPSSTSAGVIDGGTL